MMYIIKQTKYALMIIGIAILTWIIALPFIPEHIPMQYTFFGTGEETWGTNKYLAGTIIIAIMIFIYAAAIIKAKADPMKGSYFMFKDIYFTVIFFSEVLMYIVSIFLILKA